MAKKLYYGKRVVGDYKKDSKRTKKPSEDISKLDWSVLNDVHVVCGECDGMTYEITPSPVSHGFSYTLSSPHVTISKAVEKFTSGKFNLMVRYLCKHREYYVEYRSTSKENEKFYPAKGKKFAEKKAKAWLVEQVGDKKAHALIEQFEKFCDAYDSEIEKNNSKYEKLIHEQFGLHQTLCDNPDLESDPWGLQID